jgi:hypothetical protein
MSNKTNKSNARAGTSLDWNAEAETIMQKARETAGSKGDQLQRVAKLLVQDGPVSSVLREAAGDAGAAAFTSASRNVLAKLPKLATCIANGQPWCSREGLDPSARRKEDASVALALGLLGAGNERQKALVASAMERYPGGANAQMPAAMDACAFVGLIGKPDGNGRNCTYVIKDEARCAALIPQVPAV